VDIDADADNGEVVNLGGHFAEKTSDFGLADEHIIWPLHGDGGGDRAFNHIGQGASGE
jgi:hypothetical protein